MADNKGVYPKDATSSQHDNERGNELDNASVEERDTARSREQSSTQEERQSASTDASLEGRSKDRGANSRKKELWVGIVVILLVIAGIFLAVRFDKKGENATETASPYRSSMSIGLKLSPTNLDIRNTAGSSLDQVLIGNVYQGLVARNSENKVVPAIAKSWDVSNDGKTYTFHLNKNMRFSNGDVLDANDVVWSIRQLEEKKYHDYDAIKNFKSIEAPNEDTVVLELTKPFSNLLWVLTGRAGLVFDQDAKYLPKTQAVGSGPYKVKSFVPNQSLVLERNPDYWGKNKPKTPTITIKYFTDDNAAVNALKSGDVQVLAPINNTLARPFKNDSKYKVATGEGTDKYVLGMNNAQDKPTGNKKVRQAIRYAIDSEELIASRGGTDAQLNGPIPSLDPGYEELKDLYPHDLEKAKQLLKEAGYTKEHPLKLTLTYPNTYGTEIGDQLRSQLKKANIELKVKVVEFATWLDDVYANKDYDISLVDHNESHDFKQFANPDYYYNYNNPQVQKLVQQAEEATSDTERDSLYAKAARMVSEDAAADWLFNFRVTTAMDKRVEGFPLNMNQTWLPLAELSMTK